MYPSSESSSIVMSLGALNDTPNEDHVVVFKSCASSGDTVRQSAAKAAEILFFMLFFLLQLFWHKLLPPY